VRSGKEKARSSGAQTARVLAVLAGSTNFISILWIRRRGLAYVA
jgi:hypothetical protein